MKLMDYFLVYKKTIMCKIYVIIFLYVRKIRKTSVIYNVICYTHICFFFFLNSFFKSYLYIYIYNNFLMYNKNKKEQNNIHKAFIYIYNIYIIIYI